MSKYIKLEDAIEQVKTEFYGGGYQEWLEISIDNLINRIANLPTIEVSEEQLSKLKSRENSVENTTVSEDFTSISRANSKLEVSEDAISREYLKSVEYINKGDFNSVETIREWIDNAPSVVPNTEQSSMVGEWHRVSADKYVQHAYHHFRCSECGEDTIGEPNYCPNCGAKMKG